MTPKMITIIVLEMKVWFHDAVMPQKDVGGMVIIEDPDITAPF